MSFFGYFFYFLDNLEIKSEQISYECHHCGVMFKIKKLALKFVNQLIQVVICLT